MRELMQKLKNMTVLFLQTLRIKFISKEFTNLQQDKSQATYWNSCDNLPVKIFYEILKTENLSLLIRKGKAENLKLANIWADILEEYYLKTDYAKYQKNLRLAKSLIMKQNEYTSLSAILILGDVGVNVTEDLKYWGIPNLRAVKQKLLVLKTNIKIAISKLAKKEDKQAAYNFYKDLAVLEQLLGRSINSETTTVSYWIELNKLAKEINKNK